VYTLLSALQPAWTLPFNVKKIKKARVNPPELGFCRMYVHWREREHEDISVLVDEDPNAVATLMQCGLLNFFYVLSCEHNLGY
jgi:hypothetical protein